MPHGYAFAPSHDPASYLLWSCAGLSYGKCRSYSTRRATAVPLPRCHITSIAAVALQLQQPSMVRDNSQDQSSGCSYNNRLQLPSATARDCSCRHFPSPLLRSFHGASSAINAGECNVGRRRGSWGSIRASVYRHRGLQAQRGTAANWPRVRVRPTRLRQRRRASPSPWATRAGFTVTVGAGARVSPSR